jgi:hypothetical protein
MKSLQIEVSHGSNQTGSHYSIGNSPGLNQFRMNPFRVLRLPVTATSKQSLWQAEKITSLARLNLPPREPDLIPWLPGNNEMDVKQAAQKLEEPLQRILEQLFWFDFARDPKGELLCEGILQMDPQILLSFLQIENQEFTLKSLPTLKEKKHYPQDVENLTDNEMINSEPGDYEAFAERIEADKLATIFAHCINQANLHLLLALSLLHGIGPRISEKNRSAKHENRKSQTFSWNKEKKSNFSCVLNPHDLLIRDEYRSLKASDWKTMWIDALNGWSKIIANPHFLSYLEKLLEKLGEELLDEGAIYTLMHAIPTRLVDILAGEIKVAVNENNSDLVTALVDTAASATFDQNVWNDSFNTLSYFFKSELTELTCMIENETTVTQEDIQHYFKRISQLKLKFEKLDPTNLLGLLKLIDEGVIKGFDAVASLDYYGNHLETVKYLLEEAIKIAHSNSIREKINTYIIQITQWHKYNTCHFCNRLMSDPNYPVVVKGKKKTGKKGNTTFYMIKPVVVPRCKNCAEFHQFIKNVSFKSGLVLLSLSFLISFLFGSYDFFKSIGGIFVIVAEKLGIWGVVISIYGIFKAGALIFKYILRPSIASFLVPKGQKTFDDIEQTKAFCELYKEGYYIEEIDLSKEALKNTLAKSGE